MSIYRTRRGFLQALSVSSLIQGSQEIRKANQVLRPWTLTVFSADVTPPLGHPCMGGGIAPARTIVDRLEAIGFVLRGGTLAQPVVLVAVDWCELRNDAYDRWREVLARTARTDPQHVLVASVHQHDTPIADLRAQRLLEQNHKPGSICNLAFHELIVQRVSRAAACQPRQAAASGHPRRNRPGEGREGRVQPSLCLAGWYRLL